MITNQFKNSALSFAGCDGGNLNSDVWFCGLEWGGSQRDELELPIDEAHLSSWSDEDFERENGNSCKRHSEKISFIRTVLIILEKMMYFRCNG
ncbi:hypothetical protein ACWIUA_06015 [Ursidibacter sp. B-7004-1]